MNDFSSHFSDFGGRIWLNASHQGPLPEVAAQAAHEALALKRNPHALTTSQPFSEIPQRLREAIGRLIGAGPDEIILGNSASHGMHTVALGIDWRQGDEVLLVEGDFPSTTFPFLLLSRRGVKVRFITPAGPALTPSELRGHLTAKTRLFCTTWAHSFTGQALDLQALGEICRGHGTRFVINGSQAVGAMPIDVQRTPIDALISCGFKWLCGPYGTGFAWINATLLNEMKPTQLYWLAHLTADDLKGETMPGPREDIGARAYDIFGTANFNNFMPWTASIDLLTSIGVDAIHRHDQALVERLIERAEGLPYELLSPRQPQARSGIVILTHADRACNESIFERLRAEGIDISLRRGNLRFAPHLYNTPDDIDRAVDVLQSAGGRRALPPCSPPDRAI